MARLMGSAPMRFLAVRANLLARAAARFAKTEPPFTPAEKAAVLGPFRSMDARRHLAPLLYALAAEGALLARVACETAALRDLPVLLLYGAQDHGYKAGFVEKWRTLLPQSEVSLLLGSGHFSPEGGPAEYAGALADWLHRQGTFH